MKTEQINAEKNRASLKNLLLKKGDVHACCDIGDPWELLSKLDRELPDYISINHREIYPEEVVWDFDVNDAKKRDHYYQLVANKLKRYKIRFKSWTTGGKGIHISSFFPGILEYKTEERAEVKRLIIDFFTNYLTGESFAKHAKIDYQLCSRHMVRSEWGRHEKTGGFKEPLENYKPMIKADNVIPLSVKNQISKERKTGTQKLNYTKTGLPPTPFKAIDYLMSQDFANLKDGRQRALTILCSFFYSSKGKDGFPDIVQWNDYKLNGYFNEYKLKSTYYSIKRMVDSGRQYGITSIRNLMRELGVPSERYEETNWYKPVNRLAAVQSEDKNGFRTNG